ncbi:MAG: hypothetical protein WCA04_11185 [Geobacteraceae bacterium]
MSVVLRIRHTDSSWYEGLVATYKLIARHMNWRDGGTIVVPGMHGKEDVAATEALAKAEALGKNILERAW